MDRGVIGRVLIAAALVAASSTPALARAAEGDGAVSMAEASVASMLRAARMLPLLVWPDAPAPDSVAEFVPAAREQLRSQAIDGLRVPLHLRFLEARCSADGGGVALVFEEIGPPYLLRTFAYAVRGSMPTSLDDSWAGGYGLTTVLDDPEFIHAMGSDTVTCP